MLGWLAWATSLPGCALTYLVLFANGMSATPVRIGAGGVFGLALLPSAGLLLSGAGAWAGYRDDALLAALAIHGVPLLAACAAWYALSFECMRLRRGDRLPPPERIGFQPDGTAPRLRFELHQAATEPVDGWPRMTHPRMEDWVSVQPEVLARNADLVSSWAVGPQEGGCYQVGLRFTAEAVERMNRRGLRKRLAVLIDDELLLAPHLFGEIAEQMHLNGVFDRGEAVRLAGGLIQGQSPQAAPSR